MGEAREGKTRGEEARGGKGKKSVVLSGWA